MTVRQRVCVATLAIGLLGWKAVFLLAVPVVPGGANPYAWYRGDAGVVDSGGTVTEWQDQSGNNRHLNGTDVSKSVGGDPQLTNNGPGGANVVTFDGDDYFYAEAITDWGTASKGWVFAVWQRTGGEGAVYDGDGSGGRQKLDTRDDERDPPIGPAISAFACCGPPQSAFIPDTVGQNAYALTAIDYYGGAGGQERIRINGTAITISGALDSTGMAGITVGDFKNLNGGWNGDIAELIVFEGNLELTEVAEIEQALVDRWGQSTSFEWSADGVGDWAVASSWQLGLIGAGVPIANDPNHSALFGSLVATPTTVVTNADVTLNRIEFNNATDGYIVAGHGSVSLAASTDGSPVDPTMSVVGAHEFQAPVNLNANATVDVGTSSTLTLNNSLDLQGHTLSKTGDGEVAINNKLTKGTGGSVDILGGTISGSGTIGGSVTNSGGTTAPGNSPGMLTIDGHYNQGSDGTLAIQIGGTEPGLEHDVLQVLGNASLAGTLHVSLYGDFTPSGGDAFKVLTAGGELTSSGLILGGPDKELFSMNVDTTNDWIMLTTAGGGDGVPGDFNGNGVVDAADYTIYRDNLGGDSAALGGNGSGAATVVVADYDLWKQNFGSSGTGSTAAVPEPSTLLLVLWGLVGYATQRRQLRNPVA